MILAAGRGERLRPLTDSVPKAMVQAGGKPLITWHLERLAQAGYREAVINVSHLAERIVEVLGDGGRYGLRITYSREREPLETAVAQRLDDALGEMRHVDHRFAVTGPSEALEVPRDERFAACGHHRLGDGIGQRPQTLAPAGGKDHHAHFSSSSSRVSCDRAE